MNLVLPPELLNQLVDIIEPAPVGLWPLAMGFRLVASFAFCALCIGAWIGFRQYRRNAYRRSALAELAALQQRLGARPVMVPALLELLRRTALCALPPEQVASAHGAAWLDLLAAHSPCPIPERCRAAIGSAAYWPDTQLQHLGPGDIEQLAAFVRRWIRSHRA